MGIKSKEEITKVYEEYVERQEQLKQTIDSADDLDVINDLCETYDNLDGGIKTLEWILGKRENPI